jgi:hypothetical protein
MPPTFSELSKNALYQQMTVEGLAQQQIDRVSNERNQDRTSGRQSNICIEDASPTTRNLEFQGKNSAIKGILVQGLDRELKHMKRINGRLYNHAYTHSR